jgi:hypothetical protein
MMATLRTRLSPKAAMEKASALPRAGWHHTPEEAFA